MKLNVLIADDEELERRALGVILSKFDGAELHVLEAINGRDAIELAGTEAVDIALLDIRMPGMDGLQTAGELISIHPGIHIVFVSAFDEFEYAREALRLGVDEYLLKPASTEDIMELFRKLLVKITHEQDETQRKKKELEEKSESILLLEKRLRQSLVQGSAILDGLDSFLSLKGLLSPVRVALVCRITSSVDKDRGLRKTTTRQAAELLEKFLEVKNWYALCGTDDEQLSCLAVPYTDTEWENDTLAKLLDEIAEQVRSRLSVCMEMGAAASDTADSFSVLSAAQDAATLSNSDCAIVILQPSVQETAFSSALSDCCGARKVEQALEFMRTHISEDLSLPDIARALASSPYHISRLFRQYSGDTFLHVFTRLRLEAAKKLLRSNQYSIKEICSMVGFNDPAYFSRVFRKNEGISPAEYRDIRIEKSM